ncbi:CotH kinase family protein [Chitinophagales bacterium]|nr:CotH kinase family protein [Chitinophagales bacterium]
MQRIFILVSIFSIYMCFGFSQYVDHWESAILDTTDWKYLIPNFEPDTNWRMINFDDSSWQSGQGGIGYGDGDDNTIIPSTISLYLRKSFNITDISKLSMGAFHIDYDDAFVAFLNNVEIARSNIGSVGDHPTYNQTSTGQHEAEMYQGGNPSQYLIDSLTLSNILQNGNNVLSIQVHNATPSSSDLTARPFLSFGVSDSNTYFYPTPNWFSIFVFNSSNLPIVSINTNSQTIQDNNRIVADMGIIYNSGGARNYLTDPFNDYDGKISIELRGSSSQSFPKKSFSLETQDSLGQNNNVSILDLPTENDWVLYAPYSDKSLIRNVLTYNLGSTLDRYAPRTTLCELIINDEYQGVYVFTEKIKRDNDRVDIAELTVNDTIGDELTGGYIVKIDKATNGTGFNWNSPIPAPFTQNTLINFKLHYPKDNQELPVQAAYIQDYITAFEMALDGPNFLDSLTGYRNYIDVSSFIDFFIMNEVSKNVDGFRLSTYMYKDRDSNGGKLTLGPLWDFNLSFGNANYCQGDSPFGWGSDFNQYCPGGYSIPFWWDKLKTDTTFTNELKCRWESLRENQFHTDSILDRVNNLVLKLDEAQARNFEKWPVLGSYVWPNSYIGASYSEEIDFLENWITDRMIWLDDSMPGNCIIIEPETFDTIYIPNDTFIYPQNGLAVLEEDLTHPVDSNVSIAELVNKLEVKLYPNPTHHAVNIVFNTNSTEPREIQIVDFKGTLVDSYFTKEKWITVELTNFANGVYFVNVIEGQICVKRKLVKL